MLKNIMNKRRTFNKNLIYTCLSLALTKTGLAFSQKTTNINNDINVDAAANTVNKKNIRNAPPVKDERLGFGLNTIQETIQVLTNKAQVQNSNLIFLNKIPEQAPDGRRVILDINTTLPNVEKIAILFDKNPNILSAVFNFNKDLEPDVYTSIKMQQSGNLIVLVQSNQIWYMAKKTIKVLVGGCGA
jgi:sulfur-oxidizing protein SoxY